MTVELDGKRWEPVPGGSATAEDFIAARSLLHEIHQQCLWSSWVMQDRTADYDAALQTCGQWTYSDDPAAPRKTLEETEAEIEQRLAEADARFLAAEAQAVQDRAGRAEHYNPERAQATAVQVVYVSRRGSRSAVASLRTTCYGLCFVLVAMLMSSPLARNAGRNTRKRSGSRNAATKGGATVTPGWIYLDPPDPEGRIRITGELAGEALSVVFAVRPDDEVPAVRADPPSPGG